MEITFRAIEERDFEFLWRLHNEALKTYIEKTWGWDDARQREFVSEIFDSQIESIVLVDGVEAGYCHVVGDDNEIFLSSIRLLPEFQNRRIGTRLITDLVNSST